MKKKGLLVLLVVLLCLLTVACGKGSNGSKKSDSKEENKKQGGAELVKTLKCSMDKQGEGKVDYLISIDVNGNKLKKATMSMTVPKSKYSSHFSSDNDLINALCDKESGEYEDCSAVIQGSNVVATFEYKVDTYQKELMGEDTYKRLDEDALNNMKSEAEEEGYTCTIE